MKTPYISICIPVYNGENFIRDCIDSCIQQTFQDIEIIICDDGSTDNTLAIVEEYAKTHSSIKLFKNPVNIGLVANWNKCLEKAGGTWIKFLFQDDVMRADCLEVFNSHITAASQLLVCRRNFILDPGAAPQTHQYYTQVVRTLENTGHYKSAEFSASTISTLAIQNILMNFIAEPSLALFKKEVLSQVGRFDAELKQICDLEFLLRIATRFGLTYVPEKLCGFRIHKNSTTEKNIGSNNYSIDYLESLKFAIKLLTKTEFVTFRKSIGVFGVLKLKLYAKYKSYLAYRAITSEDNKREFLALKTGNRHLFFKSHEQVYFYLLSRIKA